MVWYFQMIARHAVVVKVLCLRPVFRIVFCDACLAVCSFGYLSQIESTNNLGVFAEPDETVGLDSIAPVSEFIEFRFGCVCQ